MKTPAAVHPLPRGEGSDQIGEMAAAILGEMAAAILGERAAIMLGERARFLEGF
jgi:hypothetical protein